MATLTDGLMESLATEGFATGSLADRQLAYLQAATVNGGSIADKLIDLDLPAFPLSEEFKAHVDAP